MSDNYELNQNQAKLLKSNTVRLESIFDGISQKTFGTGVLYKTNNENGVHYIFTALHCLYGERTGMTFKYEDKLKEVEIFRQNENGDYDRDCVLPSDIIPIRDLDLAIIILHYDADKLQEFVFGDINHGGFFNSYGYPRFKGDSPHSLNFKRIISADKKDTFDIECLSPINDEIAKNKIAGYSGSGLFYSNRSVLVGLITQITDLGGFAGAIIAKKLDYKLINEKLQNFDSSLEKVKHINHTLKISIDDNGSIINYEKISVNGCELNIWRAIQRLKQDLKDDWFQDPINFKFLLSKKFFLKRLRSITQENESYIPTSLAKHFTVPKSGYSTRPAIEVSFIDRIIYQAYIDKLAENLNHVLHNQIYSFRHNSGKGNNKYMYHFSIEQWKKYIYQTKSVLTDKKPFLVVADITNFFENINITLLHNYIKSLIHDYDTKDGKNELYKIIDSVKILIEQWNDKQVNKEFGIPQNRDASSFLANLFLNKIDYDLFK